MQMDIEFFYRKIRLMSHRYKKNALNRKFYLKIDLKKQGKISMTQE